MSIVTQVGFQSIDDEFRNSQIYIENITTYVISITHNSIHDDINKLTNTLLKKNKNVQCVQQI